MPAQSQIYVAVIDDDASVCRGMARLLRESGIHAIAYPSAEEFLLDRKRPSFDCLLLDVEMAGLSGLDLQERLVNSGGRIPTIFITASDDPGMRERAERLGCDAYLRSHYLANRAYDGYDHLLHATAHAWQQLTPQTLHSLCRCSDLPPELER